MQDEILRILLSAMMGKLSSLCFDLTSDFNVLELLFNRASVNYTAPFAADLTAKSKAELDEFMSVFPCKITTHLFLHIFESDFHFEYFNTAIVHNLMESLGKKSTTIAAKHFEQAIQYNIPHGKKIRGLSAVSAYKKLIGETDILTAKNKEMAHLLGWCIEMVS